VCRRRTEQRHEGRSGGARADLGRRRKISAKVPFARNEGRS
jgi:hypothetical protein